MAKERSCYESEPVTPNLALSAGEICAIIEACHKNGAALITYAGLHVEFFQSQYLRRNEASEFSSNLPLSGETLGGEVEGVTRRELDGLEVELTAENREMLEEARMAQMMTDDPLAYEQAMIDANLEGPNVDEAEGFG